MEKNMKTSWKLKFASIQTQIFSRKDFLLVLVLTLKNVKAIKKTLSSLYNNIKYLHRLQ